MNIAGGKMKETGFTHWASPNTGATNESGFSAFGGGYGNIWQDTNGISHLSFYNMGHTANFWSSTAVNDSSLYDRHLETISGMIYQYSFWSSYFYNVRCIKNN
jgi:uncharacterized protein (TIGR02145 family)